MNPFSYERASDIASACASAARPAAKFIAGGTNLVDLMKLQIEAPGQLVDITRLPLDRIEETAEAACALARWSATARLPPTCACAAGIRYWHRRS
jgi:CO/xanthine dehydrogenase FAD-binding subunit